MTQGITAALPRLGHGFRFQWEPAQDCHVLLYPEGMIKLNQSGGEILARCDGKTTVAAIVADLEKCFEMSGLEADVCAFLQMAAERNWVVLADAFPLTPSPSPADAGEGSGMPSVSVGAS